MAWGVITVAEIATRASGLELAGLREQALAEGQGDPLPEIIALVTDEVRGYVSAGGLPLGPAGTVPPQLRSGAGAIIRWRLGGRLSAPGLQTEARRKEYEDAVQQLRDVAARRFLVEGPEGPATLRSTHGSHGKLDWAGRN